MSLSCLDTVDLTSITPNSFQPITKKTICYIVGAVVIKDNKVLMVQEAKTSCYGTWYLPMGRLEPSESFEEGVKREVLEESGYDFTPKTIIKVESNSDQWWRLTYTGECNSGELKTVRDSESLSANWLDIDMVIKGGSSDYPLRCADICRLVQVGKDYHDRTVAASSPPYFLLPVENDQLQAVYIRLAFVTGDLSEKNGCILVSKTSQSLPILLTSARKNNLFVIYGFAQQLFNEHDLSSYFSGTSLPILDIAFNGHGSVNGLMLTILLLNGSRTDGNSLSESCSDNYEWVNLSDMLSTDGRPSCSHQLCTRIFDLDHPRFN